MRASRPPKREAFIVDRRAFKVDARVDAGAWSRA